MGARIIPVILCGGAGTRLWPLSRLDRPKPFVALAGGETLLQATARRVADAQTFAPPVLIAAAEHEAIVAEQLEAVGAAPALTILEPCPRGTAPAIALAALNAAPDDLLLVLPSDHLVKHAEAFRAAVAAARPAAEAGWLVTFGMAADRPETGYGYIAQGEEIAPGVHAAARFVEKPDAKTAQGLLGQGGWSWNAGIFLMRADAVLAALRRHAPYLMPDVEAAAAGAARDGARLRPAGAFARVPAQSIDHAVMERHDRVAVAPAAMGWSDAGSWEALHEAADKDEAENVLVGDVVAIDAKASLVRSDGPLVVAIGIEDMVVAATERAVLIVPRGESQRVKEAVELLVRRGHRPPTLPEESR